MITSQLAILLGVYSEVELLDHIIILFIWRNCYTLLQWLYHFTSHQQYIQGLQLYILANTIYFLFLFFF